MSRDNHALAIAARTRLDLAVTALSSARAEMSTVVGEGHAATDALSRALLEARRALSLAQTVVQRVPL
jgi:hypothetical protein